VLALDAWSERRLYSRYRTPHLTFDTWAKAIEPSLAIASPHFALDPWAKAIEATRPI
jgi:hypothetical protein